MPKTIWKFTINQFGDSHIAMPVGAEIFTVRLQDGLIQIWAIVNPEVQLETRHFRIYGTGQEIDLPDKYIGTYFESNGLVWHLFEVT